jgi:ABC-type branched-subunit amino acid transport system ATPase component
MLTLERFVEGWGTLQAPFGTRLAVHAGEAAAAIDPKGTRKTAPMRVKSAMIPPPSGAIKMQGVDVLAAAPHRSIELGTINQA